MQWDGFRPGAEGRCYRFNVANRREADIPDRGSARRSRAESAPTTVALEGPESGRKSSFHSEHDVSSTVSLTSAAEAILPHRSADSPEWRRNTYSYCGARLETVVQVPTGTSDLGPTLRNRLPFAVTIES